MTLTLCRELVAQKNGKTLSLYLRKKFESSGYWNNINQLKISYEMKVQGSWEFFNIQKGSYTDTHFHMQRLGKIICLKDLQSNSRRFYDIIDKKRLEITVQLDIIENEIATGKDPVDDLSKQFEMMFNNDKYSDFTLVTNENQEIRCHRNVLATRSPVFDAMLESQMKESSDGKAVINDINGESLMELMRFVYCGRVNKIEDFATDLLYAATKYDLKDLKPICTCSLAVNISPTNVLDTLLLADLHQEKTLKKFCFHYLNWNYEKTKDSEDWEKMPNHIMKEIIDYFATHTSQKSIINLISTVKIQVVAAANRSVYIPNGDNAPIG
jgi:BTB/POZ domain